MRAQRKQHWPAALSGSAVRSWMMAALCATSVLLTGCSALLIAAGGGAGVVGTAYVMGDVEAWVKEDPRVVELATVRAFESLQIRKVSATASALDAKIVGRTATDTKVQITVKTVEAERNKLSVRVGTFGNELLSRKIYDEIQKYLPEAAEKFGNPKE